MFKRARMASLSFFVTRFVQQGEHVLFIGFHARLVEGIYAQEVTADTTSFLEEIDDFVPSSIRSARGHSGRMLGTPPST